MTRWFLSVGNHSALIRTQLAESCTCSRPYTNTGTTGTGTQTALTTWLIKALTQRLSDRAWRCPGGSNLCLTGAGSVQTHRTCGKQTRRQCVTWWMSKVTLCTSEDGASSQSGCFDQVHFKHHYSLSSSKENMMGYSQIMRIFLGAPSQTSADNCVQSEM